jgi:hypothetical protein
VTPDPVISSAGWLAGRNATLISPLLARSEDPDRTCIVNASRRVLSQAATGKPGAVESPGLLVKLHDQQTTARAEALDVGWLRNARCQVARATL